MPRRRFTPEEIIQHLREANGSGLSRTRHVGNGGYCRFWPAIKILIHSL
ncbi:hypothetical protein Pan97_28620 [Bremerella volcania]|uniref:Uncharacterized protein n=1 Tax=Bremerella volcania TaxID=2527984 RepID=A0A518C9C8_9BACT|nr:hypothetical protein Pan97_28620 [Bremerella volcania]